MRIVALDLLRFFAAISVVLYHYISRPESTAYPLFSEVAKFGYLGVPLFFIISGYVIALSANNRTAFQFAISRFIRLYPALWVCVIFTVIVLSSITDSQFTILQIMANFTLLNEYMGFEDVDGVYWTLKAELRFYACVFLLILFGVFNKYRIWLSVWLLLTMIHVAFGQPYFMGWFISPGYSSFFIAGIACYLIQTNGKGLFNHFVLLSSLVISSFRAFDQAAGFMEYPSSVEKLISVIIVWAFYVFMYLLVIGKIQLKERSIFITLGALTYPLYLIHNTAGKAIIDQYSYVFSEEVMIILMIIFMLFVAWVIHVAFERPVSTPIKNYLMSTLAKSK